MPQFTARSGFTLDGMVRFGACSLDRVTVAGCDRHYCSEGTVGRLPVFRWKPGTAHYSLGLDAALPGPPEAQAPRTPAVPVIGPEGSRSDWRRMRYAPSKPARSLPECSESNPSSEYHPGTSISSINCPTCSTCRRTPRVSTLPVSGWMRVSVIIPPPYPMSAHPGKWRRGREGQANCPAMGRG